MQYILTDGKDIFKVRNMTQEEAEKANNEAFTATSGNLFWVPLER